VSGLAPACAALVGGGEPPMPWLAPYRSIGRSVALNVLAGRPVRQALNAALLARPVVVMAGGHGLQFVAQDELPDDEAYEAFIARTGRVPTRDNVHDLFNGLVWLRFGALKRRLNTLHAQQIARTGVGRTRGPMRDTLTLFDENAALLQAPAVLIDALRRRDWQALFVEHRAAWQGARLTLFGHALLEKLLQPRKAITAHVWVLPASVALDALSDGSGSAGALPADLASPRRLARNPRLALPVLGVPGWWAANEQGNFYRDESVFRPASSRAGGSPQKPLRAGL
jgi:hypothetical protein